MGTNILECSAEKCIHNLNNMCNAQYINVGSHKRQGMVVTNCKTFEERDFRNTVTNLTNINIAGAVDQIFTEEPVMNPNVRCGVNECIYNSNYMCSADGLSIGDYNASTVFETKCVTFKKR